MNIRTLLRRNPSTDPAHVPDPVAERVAVLEDIAIKAGSWALIAWPDDFGVRMAMNIIRRAAIAIEKERGCAA